MSTKVGKKNRNNNKKSTQTHLRIAEIKDNTIILKNGGLRSIIKTTSINFNLKSEVEQNSIIQAYQSFLNSLEFPIQILVRSKRLEIDDYIESIEDLAENQTNPLLKSQTSEYAQYIRKLIEYADIMEKEFYVIVPYDPPRTPQPNALQAFFQRLQPKDSVADIKKRHKEFEENRKKLTQRASTIQTGLESCSLKTKELDTFELTELLYKSYNPLNSRDVKIKELDQTTLS